MPLITLSASQKEALNTQDTSPSSWSPEAAADRALEAHKLQAARDAANVGLATERVVTAPRRIVPAVPSGAGAVIVTATAGNIGPTQYGTLGAAFVAINGGTHQGAITIDITANIVETGPAVLNSNGAGSASYTSVLIRPTADSISISGATATGRGLIELNGADNVTIDGDNPNTGGITRNLTIQNTAASTITFTSVVRIAVAATVVTSADNDTVKNCNIIGSSPGRNIAAAISTTGSENTTFGFFAGPGASTVSATTRSFRDYFSLDRGRGGGDRVQSPRQQQQFFGIDGSCNQREWLRHKRVSRFADRQ